MAAARLKVLITGSTDGVGRMAAERFAASGAELLIHGRDRTRGESLCASIGKLGGTATFYPADFSSLAEVRALAASLQRDHPTLDVLISNAGIAGSDNSRQLSQDGHELRFAVNYLAGFLLTRLLLPNLQSSRAGRIVNVASAGQQAIDFSDVMLTRGYSDMRAYCQSKLAQVMSTFDLAQELSGSKVIANCLHPATYMDTTMVRKSGVEPMSTVVEGADAIMQLAASPAIEGRTGLYFNGLHASRANSQAYDEGARAKLRKLSFELVGLPQPA